MKFTKKEQQEIADLLNFKEIVAEVQRVKERCEQEQTSRLEFEQEKIAAFNHISEILGIQIDRRID